MGPYRIVLVGTDGSESSLRAVHRAGEIAAVFSAKVIVASAYLPVDNDPRYASSLTDESYKSPPPADAILREARETAVAAGATDIEEKPLVGATVDVLVDLATEVDADLVVVGSVGLSTVAGRLLGSVPAGVARRANIDVLIVHTTD